MKSHCIRVLYTLTVFGIMALALVFGMGVLADSHDDEGGSSGQNEPRCPYCDRETPSPAPPSCGSSPQQPDCTATPVPPDHEATRRAANALATQEAANALATQEAANALATQEAANALATQEAANALATQEAANALATQEAANALATQEAANALATQEAANALATQEAANALATQEAANALATQEAANALATQEAANALATQEAANALATQEAANALATQEAMKSSPTPCADCPTPTAHPKPTALPDASWHMGRQRDRLAQFVFDMDGCLASYTKSECDTVYQGVITGAAALNQAMKDEFNEPNKIGALVCEKTADPHIQHDHVCPTGNEHNPNLDDGHEITIKVTSPSSSEFIDNCIDTSLACIFPTDEFEGEDPEEDKFIGDRTILFTMGQNFQFSHGDGSIVKWTNDPYLHGDERRGTGFFYIDKTAMHEFLHTIGVPDGDQTDNPDLYDDTLMGWDKDVWNEKLKQCRIEETVALVYCLRKEFRDGDAQTVGDIY